MRSAPFSGEYLLYEAAAERKGSRKHVPRGEPLATQRLGRRELIGFRAAGGETTAVAGDTAVPLTPGRPYLWQMRADKGQVDGARTAVLLIGIGLGAAAIIAASASSFTIGFAPMW